MSCLACALRTDASLASGCACDWEIYPPCDTVPPGLAALPPQALGFPQIREHLLSTAGQRTELAGWSARADDDLGVMLLESWAYVFDIVQFYNRRLASRGYVRTAPDAASLHRLTALIGYRPRPAVAAAITLAAIAENKGPAEIPAGTRLRSKGVPGIPPQVFETAAAAVADPRLNEWELAPVRPATFDGLVAFAPRAPGVLAGQTVAFVLNGAAAGGARVLELRPERMPDGADYRVATFTSVPAGLAGQPLASIEVRILTQSAGPTRFSPLTGTAPVATYRSEWVLDGVYPQIAPGDILVLEYEGGFTATPVNAVALADIELGITGHSVAGKATKLTFPAMLAMTRVHFRAMPAGPLVNPALSELPVETLVATLPGKGPAAALGDAAPPAELVVSGARSGGIALAGSVEVNARGAPLLEATSITERSVDTLATPIRYNGNVIEATRGETVRGEVLGSAVSSRPWQSFRLRKKPLTYLPDATAPGGAAPELEVRVNNILWERVDSFFGVPAGRAVYVVRHDDKEETDIVFGDLTRPPTGVNNVTASYRWGAGKAVPPPGTLVQLADRVPGLARLVAPLEARGGADAEAPEDLRDNAPRSTLTSGRAVSVADYAAIASAYAGVTTAQVQWVWVPGAQRAGVMAWIVNDGGDVSTDLAAALREAGDPLISVTVAPAVASSRMLTIEIVADPAFLPDQVCGSVGAALLDEEEGLLAPRNAAIGGDLFRSRIAEAVARVAGVAGVRSITLDGSAMPAAISAAPGHYLTFELSVGAV
ncbi:MAG: baseplate J/gp47 family protein [Alphaproteobacteria bacterium]|nr:baseplate J/gp47 family protein [Alphaproteobacteria bacterium]